MAPVYQQAGGLLFRPDRSEGLAAVDAAIFDVDGVLVDVSESYPAAISAATQYYCARILGWPGQAQLIEPVETTLFKVAGGFNSDWDVALAAVLVYLVKAEGTGRPHLEQLRAAPPGLAAVCAAAGAAGGGLDGLARALLEPLSRAAAARVRAAWNQDLVRRLAMEFYGGGDWCQAMFGFKPHYRRREPGLCNRERPLLDPARLAVPRVRRLGIYTGREYEETLPALRLAGAEGRIDPIATVTASGPFKKPDPDGLLYIARVLGFAAAVFCGDNVDDGQTVLNYRARYPQGAPVLFAAILGGAAGDGGAAIFRAMGADLIAPSVNHVLDYLGSLG